MKSIPHSELQTQPRRLWQSINIAGIFLAFFFFAPAVFAGPVVLLDANGTSPLFWDGVSAVSCDVSSSVTWTTDTNGIVAPTVGAVGDNFQFGTNQSDFNGAVITFNTLAATLGGNGFNIVATNCTVTWASTGNAHFNTSPTTVSVATNSTLIWTSTANNNGFNFNSKATTFAGGGTMNFQDTFCANGNAANVMNMPGGTIQLNQTKTSNFGSAAAASFTLANGTLQFGSASALADTFQAFIAGVTFNINGGTIDNTSGSAGKIALGAGRYSIGGNFTFLGSSPLDFGTEAVTNTANHTITMTNTLAIGGVISALPGNGLTLVGAGTLELSGASTYSGNTTVNTGITLALTNGGSIANSPLIVSNATLDISGLSAVTTLPSFSISNSTLVIAALPATTTNIMTPTLNVGGTANTVNITFVPLITSYPATNHIIKAATVNGTLNFVLGTIPSVSPAFSAYITNSPANGSVDLIITGGPVPVRQLTWSGTNVNTLAVDGTWDVDDAATWLDASANGTFFNQLDLATFNDTAKGTNVVNITATVTPGALTVSNNVLPYTFIGGGAISDGSSSLTLNKQGTGTLLLQENGDNFSGGINVSGGTVIIDNNSSGINGATIGAGATIQLGTNDTAGVLPSGAIRVNGTLLFNHSDSITVSSAISGGGNVNSFNTNTVLLSDSGTSSGNWALAIQNGTLQAADNTALGSLPGGAVTITNGGTFDVGANTSAQNANFGAKQFNIAGAGVGGTGTLINSGPATQEDAFENIVLTADSTIGGPNRWDVRNGTPLLNLAGFTLTKTNANQISMVSPHVTSGNIIIQQGILSFESTPAFDASAGTILVNSGGFLGQFKDTIGSFTRSIVLNGGGTTNLSGAGSVTFVDAPILLATNSTLGSSGGTETFNGVISDGGFGFGLATAGIGTNLLSATNTYSGNTIVNGGTLGLTNRGSISGSALIIVNNGATLDISGLSIPFTGTNALSLGDDVNGSGTLILGNTLVTNFNSISLNNAVLQMAVANVNAPEITVTNLNLGDGSAGSTINITVLPAVVPPQFPLIKYASAVGTYNISIGNLPAGYGGQLVNDTANNSIDLAITTVPAGIWNGGSTTSKNWSDAANWNNNALTGTDPLVFAGTAGLNNTNDTTETPSSITFVAGAGAFILNGNPVTLGGNIVNSSSNPQTIVLGLNFSANETFDGGSAGLIIGGGTTNTATGFTTLTLAGSGILTNILNSTTSPGGTNSLTLNSATANWTLMDNSSSTPMTNQWPIEILAGTFNFGNAGSAPVFFSTSAQGQPQDNQVGAVAGATGTLNMVNGTLTTVARLNTGVIAAGSIGVINQIGGTLNIGSQFQGANLTGGSSFVTNSGGTMNIGGSNSASAFGQFYVASRGPGVLTMNGSGALNCGVLDISRSINSSIAGVVNLNGGILSVGRVGTATANTTTTSTGSTATFNFNGGTLLANVSSTNNPATFFQGNLASPAIPITTIVKSGGAIIDDGGFAISVLEPLQHDATLGGTADGGLIKKGVGTLTLTAPSTYTGNTVVSNGTLAVNGSLGITAVTVATNATLVGTGSLGSNVTVNVGGTISPGAVGTLGTLTVASNVALNGTAAMDINATILTNDVLKAGSINYGGTLSVTNIGGTPAVGNSFQLFTSANLTGAFVATNLPSLGTGLGWSWNPANGTLSVISVSSPVNTNAATVNFTAVAAGGALQFSWAPDHLGWQLYTNAAGLAATGSWFPVPGSAAVTNETITINPSNPNVFFQLRYP